MTWIKKKEKKIREKQKVARCQQNHDCYGNITIKEIREF
jgi:hypothetical protein